MAFDSHLPSILTRATRTWLGLLTILSLSGAAFAKDVVLTWSDNSDNEDGFNIERSIGDGSFEVIAQTAVDIATYTDTSAEAGVNYNYRVNAFNAFGASGYTNVALHYINVAPTLSAIASQVVEENDSVGPLVFTVSDFESAAGELVITVNSSNEGVLDASGIVVAGTGGARTLTLSPKRNASGESTVAVNVSDGIDSAIMEFALSVNAFVFPTLDLVVDTIGAQARAGEALAVSSVFSDSSLISSVSYYLDDELIDTVSVAPFELSFGVPESGSYTLNSVAAIVGRDDSVSAQTVITVGTAPAGADLVAALRTLSVEGSSSTGGAEYDLVNDVFYLEDETGEIAGESDTHRYYYLMVEGDVSLSARLSGFDAVSSKSVAGLMVRSALYGKAQQASLLVDGAGNLFARTRTERGGATTVAGPFESNAVDSWLRIEKTGTTVRYSWRADEVSEWILVREEVMDLGTKVFVGFAIAGGPISGVASASFDHVRLGGAILELGDGSTSPALPSGLLISSAGK